MKNILIMLTAVVLLNSCGQTASVPGQVLPNTGSVGAQTPGQNDAYVLMQDLAVWRDDGGKAVWIENLTIGEKVSLLNHAAKLVQDGAEKEYTKIKTASGKEGYVRPLYLAANAQLGVVKGDKAQLFSQPQVVKVMDKSISGRTVIAVFKEGSNDEFYKISAYDTAQDTRVSDVYVAKADISLEDADVQTVIILGLAKKSKSADVKKTLLGTAVSKYRNSIFAPVVQAELDLLTGGTPKATEPRTDDYYLVNDNNVNVRSIPDEVNGIVITTLGKDTSVSVVEASVEEYVVDGKSSRWYKISSPATGWIFGAYLTSQR